MESALNFSKQKTQKQDTTHTSNFINFDLKRTFPKLLSALTVSTHSKRAQSFSNAEIRKEDNKKKEDTPCVPLPL